VKKTALTDLSKVVAKLKRMLEADVELSEADRLFIENHLLVLQFAYTEWKRRHNIGE
jgi:hypothetical protein